MVQLSTDAIVTIISTIPGLLISCLSAWFAYAALRRRHVNRNDIETATIEFIIAQISATPLSLELPYTHQFAPEVLLPSENLPQLTPPTHHNIRGRKQRQTETLLPPRFDRQNNLLRPNPVAACQDGYKLSGFWDQSMLDS